MVISGVFPFANGVKNGTLQKMMKTGKNEYFKLTPSSKSSDKNDADLILQDNESYFCSDTNTSECSNFLIIELIDRAVYVNGYVIKSNDYGYLRSWKLYGSMGSDDWKELHSRENVEDLSNNEYQWYKLRRGIYRKFKIVQTGESSGETEGKKYSMRISYFDIFGFMPPDNLCTMKHSNKELSALIYYVLLIMF